MDTPNDFARARALMVDGQVRPNKVIDPRVIAAMRALPRERFLPSQLAPRAYADEDVPLPGGRALMEPMVIARLVQLARPRIGDRALVAPAGTGYGAAVLAACGAAVTALEEDEALLALARPALAAFAPEVTLLPGPVATGVADGRPWDIVLVEGAVREIPPALAAQVNPRGGRLVTVLVRGSTGKAVLAEPNGAGGLRSEPQFDCATPLLPQFAPRPGFVF